MSCLNIPRFKNFEIHIFQSSSHARPISFGRIVCKLCRAGETCAKTLTGFEFLWAYSSARWQAPAVPSSAGRTLAQYIFFAVFKPLYFLEMYTLITYILFKGNQKIMNITIFYHSISASCTAKRKLERRQFSTSSSSVKF